MAGSTAIFILCLILLLVVAPTVIVFHYTTKWKSLKGLSDEEQRTLEDLWQDSERMHSRISALETILDDAVPDWRSRQ
jgi:phage shock protein B